MKALLLKQDFERLEERMDLRFEALELRLEGRFQKELNNLFRNLFFAMIGSQTTFTAILVAAIRL